MKAGVLLLLLYLNLAAISLIPCDAERSMRLFKGPNHGRILTHKYPKKLRMIFKHLDLNSFSDSSNAHAYSICSPNSLPPYESLTPISLLENSPPFCLYPPIPPSINPPPGSLPTPTVESVPSSPGNYQGPPDPTQNPPIINPGPPGSSLSPTPPESVLSPPSNIPGPPGPSMSPPYFDPNPPSTIPSPTGGTVPSPPYFEPYPPSTIPSPIGGTVPNPTGPSMSPPYFEPNPPSTIPSPIDGTVPNPPGPSMSPPYFEPNPPSTGGTVPSPTVFEPPIVFPPPSVPPPPFHAAPSGALWCVAKPSVPDPIIQEAMNYACGSGADCESIQPNGPCFEPNTVLAHASYSFNSYWQSTKVGGGTCDFGGTGMLVKNDPSHHGCHFVYN